MVNVSKSYRIPGTKMNDEGRPRKSQKRMSHPVNSKAETENAKSPLNEKQKRIAASPTHTDTETPKKQLVTAASEDEASPAGKHRPQGEETPKENRNQVLTLQDSPITEPEQTKDPILIATPTNKDQMKDEPSENGQPAIMTTYEDPLPSEAEQLEEPVRMIEPSGGAGDIIDSNLVMEPEDEPTQPTELQKIENDLPATETEMNNSHHTDHNEQIETHHDSQVENHLPKELDGEQEASADGLIEKVTENESENKLEEQNLQVTENQTEKNDNAIESNQLVDVGQEDSHPVPHADHTDKEKVEDLQSAEGNIEAKNEAIQCENEVVHSETEGTHGEKEANENEHHHQPIIVEPETTGLVIESHIANDHFTDSFVTANGDHMFGTHAEDYLKHTGEVHSHFYAEAHRKISGASSVDVESLSTSGFKHHMEVDENPRKSQAPTVYNSFCGETPIFEKVVDFRPSRFKQAHDHAEDQMSGMTQDLDGHRETQ